MSETRVFLSPAFFGERERVLVEYGGLAATAFRFESGVCGLRLENELGELVMLPFQGQQIWSAEFEGRALTQKSMFEHPHPTRSYLETYGAFLIHCGFTAMGVPGPADNHPLHGELPNAPYHKAWVVSGEDEQGPFLEVGGEYEHTVAFSCHYVANPAVRLYAGKSTFWGSMSITNLKNTPMEYLYLAHINFRPVDNGRLVYSAPYDAQHVQVRTSIPSHVRPPAGYREFLEALAREPEKHHVLAPGMGFDPEVVFFIDYDSDAQGWAHSMQVHPDGTADYVRHQPEQLDHGVRWISRTPDQDALGFILPATAEPEGYMAEKGKGNVKTLGAGEVWECQYEMGVLNEDDARAMEANISRISGR